MEGVGSRLSRTSSRYSGPAATAVFSGRVRKWKKKWVRVSTSSVGVFRASKANGRSNNSNSNSSNSPHHLLLHKWTPLTSPTVAASDANGSGETEEPPPKRRFRYAPIAMLEHREKVASKDSEIEEALAEETDEFDTESPLPKTVELDMNISDTDQTKEAKTRHLKLGLCLNSEGTEE